MGQMLSARQSSQSSIFSRSDTSSTRTLDARKCSYKWTIEDFSFLRKATGQELQSPLFSLGDDNLKWYLGVFVRGTDQQSADFFSLFAYLFDSDRSVVCAEYELSIMHKNTKLLTLGGRARFERGKGFGWPKLITRRDLLSVDSGLLPNDKLTIQFQVSLLEDAETVGFVPECHVLADVAQLFCTFAIGGREFQVQKCLLSAASPLFAAMLDSNREMPRISITSDWTLEPDVLDQVMHFIFSGSAPRLEQVKAQLLVAADKLQLENLKVVCELKLAETLTVQNACDTLVLADKHSAAQLRRLAKRFIELYAGDVTQTEGWRKMLTEHPNLVTELFKARGNSVVSPGWCTIYTKDEINDRV